MQCSPQHARHVGPIDEKGHFPAIWCETLSTAWGVKHGPESLLEHWPLKRAERPDLVMHYRPPTSPLQTQPLWSQRAPTCHAFASASIAPNGYFHFLLRATITSPSLSLITTPTPTCFLFEKTTPSMLIVYSSWLGGYQETVAGINLRYSVLAPLVLWYSTTKFIAFLRIVRPTLPFPPIWRSFLFFQMLQQTVVTCYNSPGRRCSHLCKFSSTSMNF